MNSIRGETVALDTNVFVFALRKEPDYPACETLLFDKLPALQVYMPLQIFRELQRNLTTREVRRVVRALTMAQAVTWDDAPAQMDLIHQLLFRACLMLALGRYACAVWPGVRS